jgi:hypothetical protein
MHRAGFDAVIVVVLGFGGMAGTASTQPAGLEQPDQWRPFTASLRITEAPGTPEVTGRVYRRSDGSERNETGPAGGPIKVISIRNHEVGAFFVWTEEKGWRRHPLGSPAMTRPPRFASRPGQYEVVAPSDGLRMLRTTRGQSLAVLSPDLNMYTVRREDPDGRRVELHGIQIGEPAADLFLPPRDAPVTEIPTPVDSFRAPAR